MRFRTWIKTPRGKKSTYIVLVCVLVLWVVFRFVMIGIERGIHVYNPARAAIENGVVVDVMEMHAVPGVIREPLTVKNNRAYVSGARARLIHAGMPVGDGKIVSVASGIDYDTGMHAVRTANVADGMHYAEFRANGFFVPMHAINNGHVFVVRDGHAVSVPVTVSRSDVENAYITSGLTDGDIVILSRVSDGEKVQINR